MHRLLMVIRREYLERVRKRSFWLGTMLFPLLLLGLVLVQIFLTDVESGKVRTVVLVDATGKLSEAFQLKLAEEKTKEGKPAYRVEVVAPEGGIDETRKRLEPRILSGEVFGILTLGDKPHAARTLSLLSPLS